MRALATRLLCVDVLLKPLEHEAATQVAALKAHMAATGEAVLAIPGHGAVAFSSYTQQRVDMSLLPPAAVAAARRPAVVTTLRRLPDASAVAAGRVAIATAVNAAAAGGGGEEGGTSSPAASGRKRSAR